MGKYELLFNLNCDFRLSGVQFGLPWTCYSLAEWNRLLFVCTEQAPDIVHPFGHLTNHQSHLMQIGISVEPTSTLQQLTPAAGVGATAVDSYREFCTHMVQSCYNYLASFASTRTQLAFGGAPNDEFVPLIHLHTWYESFERRLAQNPNFWKSWLSKLSKTHFVTIYCLYLWS